MLHEEKGVGEEILPGGEEKVVAADGEGYGALGIALGADVEGCVASFSELELGAELEERGLLGIACGHAGDVEELEFADVVPGEEGLVAGDLLKEVEVWGEAGGGGELVLRIVESAEEAGAGEGGVVIAGEPGALLG